MKFNNIVSVPGSDGVIVGITNSLLGRSVYVENLWKFLSEKYRAQ